MRTTIRLDDDLMRQAKQYAVEEGVTFTAVVHQALRELLSRGKREPALEFVEALRAQPNCVLLAPCERHWPILARLCRDGAARGNLVPDAYLAAIAIESGSELVTADRDFTRFPGLKWRPPPPSG
jgi:toxin-antitoxin system PIN domain toxin